MRLTSFYTVLATRDVAATAAFYRDHFEFETTFEIDWYVSLRLESWELAVLDTTHSTIPEAYRGRTADGVLLNIEVDDVDAVHDRLLAAGLAPVLPLRSEDFGQRHAIFPGPDGVLVDVITPIPPSAEFAAMFSPEALEETFRSTGEDARRGHRDA